MNFLRRRKSREKRLLEKQRKLNEQIEKQKRLDRRIINGIFSSGILATAAEELDKQIERKMLLQTAQHKQVDSYTSENRDPQRREKSRIEILLERQRRPDGSGVVVKREAHNLRDTITQVRQVDISNIKINLSGNLELSNIIFDNFTSDGDIIIYSFNKFYTVNNYIGEEDTEAPFLCYKGKKLKIEESENLKDLEARFLEKNRDNIKNFQLRNLDKLSEEYNEIREKIFALKNSINKDFSIEDLISDYIFALYQGKKITDSLDYKDIKLPEETLTEKTRFEEIDFSDMENSVLEKLVDEISYEHNKRLGGIIIRDKNIYGFFPIEKKRQINYDDTFFLDSVINFNKRYKEKLSEEIKKRIRQNFDSEILKIDESRETLKKLDNKRKKNINNRHGNIGFDKINNNEYVVFRKLPEYILGFKEKDEEEWHYYLFPEVNIGTRIFRQGYHLSFSTEGFVYKTPQYYHPFVWDKTNKDIQSICYGTEKPEKTVGIEKTDYNIKIIDKKEFAIGVLRILDETEKILTECSYKGTRPVHSLNNEKIEEKKISAREALSMQGIKVHYIDKTL